MNELIERAMSRRPLDDDLAPMIFCESGAISVRRSTEGDWGALQEGVILPLLAHLDFGICMEAYLATRSDQPPSENPDATEAVVYYLFEAGEMTEMWVLPMLRGDRGEISYGKPWQMAEPAMIGEGALSLVWMIRLYHEADDRRARDRSLEHQLAYALSTRGHVIVWENITQEEPRPTKPQTDRSKVEGGPAEGSSPEQDRRKEGP